MATTDKNIWILLVAVLSGLVVGGLIGKLAGGVPWLWWLSYEQEFGLAEPIVLDLSVLKLTFGFMMKINMKVILFISLKNEIRKNAREIIKFFNDREVEIRVISGDNPVTVSSIAKEVGIKNYDLFVDCSLLKTRDELKNAVDKYKIFGRVSPEQKREIIKLIKENGLKVAMTGDGVNDILAMKEADCSIAMGNGSDAAREAAQVVLLDSDFGNMRNIVYEGRKNINNITRSASLFTYKNIFSEATQLIKVNIVAFIVLVSILFIINQPNFSRIMLILLAMISTFFAIIERFTIRAFLRRIRINNKNIKHILIVGDNELAFKFARKIRENPYMGFVVSGFLGRQDHIGREIEGSSIIGSFSDIDAILDKNRFDRVVLAIPLQYYDKINEDFN